MADFMRLSPEECAALRQRLKELFIHDEESGDFIVRKARGKARAGAIAGSINKATGYREIMVDGVSYRAHRLTWLFHTGEWPSFPLDHINCDKAFNRFSNLRKTSISQNGANCSVTVRNGSGLKGVVLDKRYGSWRAFIKIDNKSKALGTFPTKEEAHAAYCKAAVELYGEFARFA